MDERCKDLTTTQKVALPSVQAPLCKAKRETKIPELALRCTWGLGGICSLLYKVSAPRSSYTAAEELTHSFLDPAFSLPDNPPRVLDTLL